MAEVTFRWRDRSVLPRFDVGDTFWFEAGIWCMQPTWQACFAGKLAPTPDLLDLTNDGDDHTRRLIREVLGAVSEFEKRVIVLKLRAARERKRARGERVEGVKPYGFFPAEKAILERMRQLRRKPPKGHRLSIAKIAAQINGEGHRNRAGRGWSPQMVHHVLQGS